MFDHPIPLPSDSFYTQLGVLPEATAEELREAMSGKAAALRARKAKNSSRLESVLTAIPGLRELQAEVNKLQADGKTTPEALTKAMDQLCRLKLEAMMLEPLYGELCELDRSLDEEVLRVNRMALQNRAERLTYDREHPPFELLKLVDCTRDELGDARTAAQMLREELNRFFGERGETVFHTSDLTRMDFRDDFAPNVALDDPR